MDYKKMINIGVRKGLPLIGGLALATALVPVDGGVTLIKTSELTVTSATKFGLVTLMGYGATKSLITPDQFDVIEAAATRAAEKMAETIRQQTVQEPEPVAA